jgi:DNA invertase Pin-like site-specific DNA recombinase
MQSVAQLSKPGRADVRANGSARGLVTALIYTRVSTEDQAREGVSLDAQLAECRRYAARPGWVLGDEYQDILSGKRDDRPQYQALLADVRRLRAEGRQVAVVVAALDRFGRAILERVRCREELKALGVATHTVREGGEVSDIVANVLAAVAQEEVRRLGARVSEVRAHVVGTGWKFPGRSPWGYAWRPATDDERRMGAPRSVPELDPVAAPYAREAWERAAAGQSARRVALWVAGLPSALRAGRNLRYAAVRAMFSSPVYVGRLEVHPEPDVLRRPRGRWPALIDDETYRRVQEQIASHAQRPKQASGRYLLTGFIHCAKCGARMVGDWGYGRQTPRYRCSGSMAGAAAPSRACTFTAVGPPIEAAVRTEVARVVDAVATRDIGLQESIRRAWAELQTRKAQPGALRPIRQVEQVAERARERLKRAALLFVDGQLDKTGYDLARVEAEADLEAAETELGRIRGTRVEPDLPSIDTVLREAGGWQTIVEGSDLDAQRGFLTSVVGRVVPVRVGRARYEPEISWTPTGELLRRLAAVAGRVVAA